MRYTPNSPAVVADMIKSIGFNSWEDLFSDVPETLRLKRELNLPTGMTELELRRHMKDLAVQNISLEDYPCFLGAGAYDHYIPAAVEQLLLRSEFYTAYTPYQAEMSQGILQSIFEYQTMICMLTGMEVANASVYDGASALAEACNVAAEVSGKKKILLPTTLHPEYRRVVDTYALSGYTECIEVAEQNGVVDRQTLLSMIDGDTAAVVLQQPNFYGVLEDLSGIADALHAAGKGQLILVVDPISLAILKPPAEYGADMVVGEGQSLGNPLSYGGPYLGFMAASAKLMRKIPGRIVGQTLDEDGLRAFVLTLQAREQHIRREKAGSNICSNEALNALTATMYLSMVGPQGLTAIAKRCHHLAVYAESQLAAQGLSLAYYQPYFREFIVSVPEPEKVNQALLQAGIIGGYPLKQGLMLAFTEKRTRAEIDQLVAVMGGKK